MIIRPLHKIKAGHYISSDKNWMFKKLYEDGHDVWYAYQKMIDRKFYNDTPYFFYFYPTLESLIKKIENIDK